MENQETPFPSSQSRKRPFSRDSSESDGESAGIKAGKRIAQPHPRVVVDSAESESEAASIAQRRLDNVAGSADSDVVMQDCPSPQDAALDTCFGMVRPSAVNFSSSCVHCL